jgi:predicted  nucleic acid-binding Zn-ribbon protein
MPSELEAELQAVRRRLAKVQDHLHKQAVIVADARDFLERESTWPKPRRELEEALAKARDFDVPMLLTEWIHAERRAAELEREIAAATTPGQPVHHTTPTDRDL